MKYVKITSDVWSIRVCLAEEIHVLGTIKRTHFQAPEVSVGYSVRIGEFKDNADSLKEAKIVAEIRIGDLLGGSILETECIQ